MTEKAETKRENAKQIDKEKDLQMAHEIHTLAQVIYKQIGLGSSGPMMRQRPATPWSWTVPSAWPW